jgi:SRSO17 transposase
VVQQEWGCGRAIATIAGLPDKAMKVITRNIDRRIWRDLMNKSGMLSLMDAQARTSGTKAWRKTISPRSLKTISLVPLSNFIQQTGGL